MAKKSVKIMRKEDEITTLRKRPGKIFLNPSGTLITPYDKGQCSWLEFETREYDPISHKSVEVSGFINKEDSEFATYSLDEKALKPKFPNYEIIRVTPQPGISLCNRFDVKDGFRFTDTQNALLADSIMSIHEHNSVFVNLPTGVGKTVMALELISNIGKKAIIITYSVKILEQWQEELFATTTAKENSTLIIKSSSQIDAIMEDRVKGLDLNKVDIFLITTSLITSYCASHGWHSLSKVFKKLNIGVKVVDEAHRRFATTVKVNAYAPIRYNIYLSADFNQASFTRRKHFFNAFRKVPLISINKEEMVQFKHINAVVYEYNSHPPVADQVAITNNAYSWNLFQFSDYEFRRGMSFEIIKEIIHNVLKSYKPGEQHYKILILEAKTSHVDAWTDMLREEFPDITIGRYHNEVSSEEKEETKRCEIIVSTYQSFSTAMNIVDPKIRHCISTVPVDIISHNQAAGRCRQIPGKWSYYWILVDKGFEYPIKNLSRTLVYLQKSKIGMINHIEKKDE